MRCTVLLATLLLMADLVFAQTPDRTWRASWIGLPDSTGANAWLCFRKDVTLSPKKNQPVRTRIACDSKYWLYVNGRLAVFEGQLKRGPNPTDAYYDEVDIARYLKPGRNTIAVLVWYFGKDGFSHKNSGRAGLLFDADVAGQRVLSDVTWQVRRHPAFGQTGNPQPNYRLPESNIHFDARLDNAPTWFMPATQLNWSRATVLAGAEAGAWGKLHKRPIPMWHDSGLLPYTRIEKEQRGDTLVVRAYLPQNVMITPYLSVKSRAGQLIDIRTDNYRGGSEPNIRAEYITKVGPQTFESPAFFNGHYVIYRMPADVEIIALNYRETRFDTDLLGLFVSDDPALNRLHQKAINTLRVGLRDHIHDCPDRERAQWWGDVVITMGELFYAADTNAHSAIRKAMLDLVNWQKPSGVLYSPVPAGNWQQELPPQMLASIGTFGFWHYYENTGDRATIERVYPAVKKYLSLYQTDSSGLVVHREGGWLWHDWGKNVDVPVLDNAWYYVAVDGAARMAQLLNRQADYDRYMRAMVRLKPAFQTAFWTGSGYRSAGYVPGYDDRAQGMAIVAGLSEAEQWPTMRRVLDTTFNAGPYMEKYILEAYFQQNDAEAGLARMKKRYRIMIDSPLTTLWEGWNIGDPTYGGGTYNHGWTGGPLTLMHQYIAGLRPLEPAYARYEIKPQLAGLKHIKTISQTRNGPVSTEIDQTKQQTRLRVQTNLPGAALIYVPKPTSSARTLRMNGQVIFIDNKAGRLPASVRRVSDADTYFLLEATGPFALDLRCQ